MDILIVDNDREVRLAITDIILRHTPNPCDDRIYDFRNGRVGYEAINIGSCDLLIVDCGPETEGALELIRKVKNDENLKKVPVIAISDYPVDEERAMAVGANEFISKPFNGVDFVSKIKNLINT